MTRSLKLLLTFLLLLVMLLAIQPFFARLAIAATVLTDTSVTTPISALRVLGSTATNNAAIVSLNSGRLVAVQVNVTSGAANTSNTVVQVDQSLDRSNWIAYSTITAAGAGTLTSSVISNYDVGATAYFRLSVTNAGLATATNSVTVKLRERPN